ncbi:hypothetical protein PsorP6_009756 [Peronosclerospora sorghi]|uniref:Uncharacterized protein n=1 Tax=Peronosclerospora sorghi TaxID=230839 RepID=A0ACC0VZZ1_9STRA|nr:hypothetical protein PsorP6_009756 [Peronosclerospora sorghi]
MVAFNLKGQAAKWFNFNQEESISSRELFDALQAEFIPPDFQERLCAKPFRLKQANCDGPDSIEYHILSVSVVQLPQHLLNGTAHGHRSALSHANPPSSPSFCEHMESQWFD